MKNKRAFLVSIIAAQILLFAGCVKVYIRMTELCIRSVFTQTALFLGFLNDPVEIYGIGRSGAALLSETTPQA